MTTAYVRRGRKNNPQEPVSANWDPNQPTYNDLLKLNQELKSQLIELLDVKRANVKLKQDLAASEHQRKLIAHELTNIKKKHELLNKKPTEEMLKRATTFLLKEEEQKQAADIIKKLKMVKDVKTGKWIPQ